MCHGGLLLIRVSELTERNTSQFSTAVTFLCGFRSFSHPLPFSLLFSGDDFVFGIIIYLGSARVCVCVWVSVRRWRKGDGIMTTFDSVTGSY